MLWWRCWTCSIKSSSPKVDILGNPERHLCRLAGRGVTSLFSKMKRIDGSCQGPFLERGWLVFAGLYVWDSECLVFECIVRVRVRKTELWNCLERGSCGDVKSRIFLLNTHKRDSTQLPLEAWSAKEIIQSVISWIGNVAQEMQHKETD